MTTALNYEESGFTGPQRRRTTPRISANTDVCMEQCAATVSTHEGAGYAVTSVLILLGKIGAKGVVCAEKD